MRPRGEIRLALQSAAGALAQERRMCELPGGHWREMAERACVGYVAARETVRNMARAGELRPIGETRVPGSRRPMTVYAPVVSEHQQLIRSIQDLMQLWARA